MTVSAQRAEIIALRALSWLVGNDDLRGVFMGATGVSEEDLRTRAHDLEFLASVLDFLMMDDAWITGFCDAEGLACPEVPAARTALPGGELPHWT